MPEDKKIIIQPGQLSQPDPYRLFAKGVYQYNPSDLVGRKGLRIYDQMRKDEQIKSAIAFKKHAVIAAGYDIVSPDGVPDDWEPTEFCNWSLDNLSGSVSERILMILTSIEYGFSVSEIVWGEPLSGGPYSGKWPLEDIVSIKPHCIRFDQDQQGKILKLVQYGFGEEIELPPEKMVLMTYQNEWSNPYGRSDFEAVYRSFWNKDAAHKWLAMLLERFGIPPIFAMYDYNQYVGTTLEELKKIIDNVQAATAALIPRLSKEGLELWTPQLASQVADVFIPALDRYDTEIARGILMPNLLGATPEAQHGSFARAAVVFDVFMMAVDSLRAQVEECINDQIIWRLVSVNYPSESDEYPRFKFKPLTQDARIGLMEVWTKLVGGMAVVKRVDDEVHIREIMGFPSADSEPIAEPEPTVPAVEEEEEDEEPTASKQAFAQFKATQIDFKAIEKRLDSNEKSFISEAKDDLENVLTILQRRISSRQQPTSVTAIRGMGPFQASLRIMMVSAFEDGRNDFASEAGATTKKFQALPRVKPRDAIAFLKRKAITLAGIVEDEIIKDVRHILIAGVESGMSTIEVRDGLGVVFEKWIGSPNLRDGRPIKPYRLEAIARTESTSAYNQGRVVAARDPEIEGLVRGLRHDSILDSRTTEVCQMLDGRIHRINSPDLDALTPPLHTNCRSILTPITISREVDESEFITPSEVGKAKELAGSGFAGGGSF